MPDPDTSGEAVFCVGYKSQFCFSFHTLNAQAIKSSYVLAGSFIFRRSELPSTYFLCLRDHFKALLSSCALSGVVRAPSVENP